MAANKPAWQSSTTHQGFATNAVAEHRSNNVGFSRTALSESPWWIVDLEAHYKIEKLIITTGQSNGEVNAFFENVGWIQCSIKPFTLMALEVLPILPIAEKIDKFSGIFSNGGV